MDFSKKVNQKGQAVLIILLIIAVVLTIGLSTISSSTTDIKVSQQTEESSRAFYVAESGLEEAFLLNAAPTGTIGNIDYTVTKSTKGGENETEFLFPYQVSAGDPQTVWLIGHKEADGAIDDPSTAYDESKGKLKVCWGNPAEKSAMMITLVYESGGYKIARYNYDPDPSRGNNFDLAEPGSSQPIEGQTLAYCSRDIVLPAGITPYFIRMNLLYNTSPTSLGVVSLRADGVPITEKIPDLPTQGFCFESTATVKESGITRKIRQCKLWPNLPNIFSWGLFSKEGDLGGY